jgi:hypothetical protein
VGDVLVLMETPDRGRSWRRQVRDLDGVCTCRSDREDGLVVTELMERARSAC